MEVACFSTKPYDQEFLSPLLQGGKHTFRFLKPRLEPETAILAEGCQAVCAFVNDQLDADVLQRLSRLGVQGIALRCAGFNNVDLQAADKLQICVARVPKYSPHAVAEHTLGLILALNRKIHKAYNRVRENNFSLDGLLGFDLHGKTVGLIGTGEIGSATAKIFAGFGCKLLMFDVVENGECQSLGDYVDVDTLLRQSQIVSLHCPLNAHTHHLIDDGALRKMRPGAMLVNTSRGALVDALAVIDHLKSKHLGGVALDVYEEESELFFEDLSTEVIQDDIFSRLLTFPNVLVTAHQAFFTEEALRAIAETTIHNLNQMQSGKTVDNRVTR